MAYLDIPSLARDARFGDVHGALVETTAAADAIVCKMEKEEVRCRTVRAVT